MSLERCSGYAYRRAVAQLRVYGLAHPKLDWMGGTIRRERWLRGGVTLAKTIESGPYPRRYVDQEAVDNLVAAHFARNEMTASE